MLFLETFLLNLHSQLQSSGLMSLIKKIVETDDIELMKSCRNVALVHASSSIVKINNYLDLIIDDIQKVPDAMKIFFICSITMEKELQEIITKKSDVPYSRYGDELTSICERYMNGQINEKQFLKLVKEIKY
jgi:hypothetical protein